MHGPETPHPIDMDLARTLSRDRAADAARRASGRRFAAEATGINPRPSLRRAIGTALINAGLKLLPDHPIRDPSPMRAK